MSLDVSALKEQIEKEKESLKNVDENIKKITGRDPNEPRQGIDTRRISLGSGVRGHDVASSAFRRRRNVDSQDVDRDSEPPRKRPAVFSRLGGLSGERRDTIRRPSIHDKEEEDEEEEEEELATKPAVQSSVVSTAKKITRDELINAQNVGEKGKARNRRMFGMLLGTLARFNADGQGRQSKQALKQKEVESRLEEQNEQERRKLASERKTLFTERRMQQRRINLMEEKIALANELEEWEKEWEMKSNSIMTKATPGIFFLPTGFTPRTQRALQESKERIKGLVEKRKTSVADTMRAYDDEIKFLENKQDGHDDSNGKGGVRNGAGRAGRAGGAKMDDEPEEEMDLDSMEHHVDIKVDVDETERNGGDGDNEARERDSDASRQVDEAHTNDADKDCDVGTDAAVTSPKNERGETVENLTAEKSENAETEREPQPDSGKGSIGSENNVGKNDDATNPTRSEQCSGGEVMDTESEKEQEQRTEADTVEPDVESAAQEAGVEKKDEISSEKTEEKQPPADRKPAPNATAALSSSSESEGEKNEKKRKKAASPKRAGNASSKNSRVRKKRDQSSSDSDSSSSSSSSSSSTSSDERSKKAARRSRDRASRDGNRSSRRGRDRSRSRERRSGRRDRNRR